MEVAEAEGLPVDEFHLVVEALGDAIVAGKAPHGGDLFGPRVQGLAELDQLRQAGLAQLVQLGQTLHSWSEQIAAMWRFTRNNGITEGFHNKMELINRQAFGFRNFQNYRLRVKVLCG